MAEHNRSVFLTGCSRGIGLEIARECLRKGWKVIGTARKSDFPDVLKKQSRFKGIHLDLSDLSRLKEEILQILDQEKPDVLINNAGIFVDADHAGPDDHWLEVWDQTMNINLKAPALLCKWFLNFHTKPNSQTSGASIINIASRASYRGDTQEYAAYAASKAGLVGLTKSIARDYSKRGVVAYSVAPGFIETDMAKDAVNLLGKDHVTAGSAFDEITQPDEVAKLVAFLAEGSIPHASGQTFHINGGSYMI
ncbi:SDR family oxidoreductase [Rhodohalobacter sp. SW132]|uniref:SDR family NAD(P)-dependent oxidoreductase n=1 Tax=Rhodohalobacter sp. SW132 TaxID=2293433 RepID=UPI000E25AB16|nr:SDR family oxidoreductase [Rhodohalobacter sp. SW132]REL33692.1 SDR family oxidoreductase [Rhodohalobacter sp. SW132]